MNNEADVDGSSVVVEYGSVQSAGKASMSTRTQSTSKGKANVGEAKASLQRDCHQHLLELFTAVDHAYCFLTKNSIPARVASLQSMVWHLFPGRFGGEASFLSRLRRLADMAPGVMVLEGAPEEGVYDDLKESGGVNKTEVQRLLLRFPQKSTAGTGKATVSRRQQLVRRALLEYVSRGRATDDRDITNGSVDGARVDGRGEEQGKQPLNTKSGSGSSSSSRAMGAAAAASVDSVGEESSLATQERRKKIGKSKVRGGDDGLAQTNADGTYGGETTRHPDAAKLARASKVKAGARARVRKAGAQRKAAASASTSASAVRVARLREPKDQPSTGKPLSASEPLSMSPAYVSRLRDPKDVAEAADAEGPLPHGSVSDPEASRGKGVPLSGDKEQDARGKEGAASEWLRFDPQRALEHLKSLPMYKGQAVHAETLPGRAGEFADTARPLHPEVAAALDKSKGVTRLFKHQALAIDAALAGRHVSLSTATSSGKSVVFNVSVLEAILGERPDAVAIYLFPTKALAQDQLRSLKELVGASSYLSERVRPMTLDGDTPFSERGEVVEEANIVLTNPDMLHASVLPGHKRFRRILGNLSHVVIDEAHVYRGAFGAHVSMVLRRLLRLWAVNAKSSGPPPQFISCSATMSEARSHFASLLPLGDCLGGQRMLYSGEVDTAPAGRKTFILWQPPIVEDWITPPMRKSGGSGSATGGKRRKDPGGSRSWRLRQKRMNPSVPSPAAQLKVSREDAETDLGSDAASPCPSLDGIHRWRKGPTDNFYNREYMKLMWAELPRPVAQAAASTLGEVEAGELGGAGAGRAGRGRRGRENAHDCVSEGSGSLSTPPRGRGALIALEEVVQRWGDEKRRSRAGQRASSAAAISQAGSEEAIEAAASAGLGASDAGERAGAGAGAITTAAVTKEGGGVGWEDARRRSPICETAQILTALVKQRVRTLAFCRTRKLTELTLRYGRQDLERTAPHLASLVQGYRGGYTKEERRLIESHLFSNKLLGCTATCALELGVDIGELDATLHLGFPGSVSSLRQQAGRAGRGSKDSLAIMVLFQDPISQYFVRNPSEVWHKKPEAAALDSKNDLVLRAHLLCAAAECPLGVPALGAITDAALFGGDKRLQAVIDTLIGGDFPRLVRAPGSLGWRANPGLDPPPYRRVSLRMIDPVSFSVVDDSKGGEPYDTVEYSRAFFTLFEGAIYLHQARQYLVTKLDLATHVAHTKPVKVQYYTTGLNNVDVKVTKRLEVSDDNFAHTGCVDVVCTVYGFVKKQFGTGITVEKGECRLPPLQYATRALWLDVGVTAKRAVEDARRDFEGGVHAVGHALLSVVPLFLLCDPEDVDCEHVRPHYQRPQPRRILVYDKRPGGVGVADAMFDCHRAVLSKALELVEGCPCPDGCVACIHDHGCTGYNSIIDKQAALIVLKRLIQDMMEAEAVLVDRRSENKDAMTARCGTPRRPRRLGGRSGDDGGESQSVLDGDGGFFLDERSAEAGATANPERSGADSGVWAAATMTRGDGGTGGGKEKDNDAGVASPRKKQRLRNLRVAKTMERAREQDMAVLGCWIPSVP